MHTEIIVALIGIGGGLIGSFFGHIVTYLRQDEMLNYKINEMREDFARLEVKVEKHNNLVEKMSVAERDIQSAHRRLDFVCERLNMGGTE